MQVSHRLAALRRDEEAKLSAFRVAEIASPEDHAALLNERGTVEGVQVWLERCTDVDMEKAAQVALDLFELLRSLSGETYQECERERQERIRGARR